jgi:Domain of unknown function (DUF5979)
MGSKQTTHVKRRLLAVMGVLALAAGVLFATMGPAVADGPSDPRASFEADNAQGCEDIGFGDSTEIGSGGNPQASGTETSDSNITVLISDYEGDPGNWPGDDGQMINVTSMSEFVVIDAVVVKAGSNYNQYDDVVTNMIPPLVGENNNLPAISHWFLCYSLGGSLSVDKVVTGNTAGAPPTFTVRVECTDDTLVELVLSPGTPQTVDGIEAGSTCTVTELGGFTNSITVDGSPSDGTGITIVAGETTEVVVTNDIPDQPVPPGPDTAVAAVQAQPAFTG